jgi:hypothetical protein
VPFYAPGVSYGDVVNAHHSSGQLAVTGVSARSGHSTYRVILNDGITEEEFETAWLPMAKLGCTYERATPHLFGIDVPPATNVAQAYELLTAGQARGVWDFEEGHYGHGA